MKTKLLSLVSLRLFAAQNVPNCRKQVGILMDSSDLTAVSCYNLLMDVLPAMALSGSSSIGDLFAVAEAAVLLRARTVSMAHAMVCDRRIYFPLDIEVFGAAERRNGDVDCAPSRPIVRALAGAFNWKIPRAPSLMFWWACTCGCVQTARRIANAFNIAPDDTTNIARESLAEACASETLDIARLIKDEFRVHPDENMLCDACESGKLAVARWLAEEIYANGARSGRRYLPRRVYDCCEDSYIDEDVLTNVLYDGNVEVADWILDVFDVPTGKHVHTTSCDLLDCVDRTWKDVDLDDGRDSVRAIYDAERHLRTFRLERADWIVRRIADGRNTIPVHESESGHNRATFDHVHSLRIACGQGKTSVAQWITTHFSITRDEAIEKCNLALRSACMGGHGDLVRWFVDTFAITRKDVLSNDVEAALRADAESELSLAIWLGSRYDINLSDAAYVASAVHGRLRGTSLWNVLSMRYHQFDPMLDALSAACCAGDICTAQWLVGKFGISKQDVNVRGFPALAGARSQGHHHVVKWLVSMFGDDTSVDEWLDRMSKYIATR